MVGTLGRLLDLVNRGVPILVTSRCWCWTKPTRCWIWDSCPMSSESWLDTPEPRQTMLFSATMPAAIVTLARRHMRHPVNIRAESAGDTTTVPATRSSPIKRTSWTNLEVVARIPQAENCTRVMIFCRTVASRRSDCLMILSTGVSPRRRSTAI